VSGDGDNVKLIALCRFDPSTGRRRALILRSTQTKGDTNSVKMANDAMPMDVP